MENYKVPRNKKQEESNETILLAIKDEDKWLDIYVPLWHNFRLNREAIRMVKNSIPFTQIPQMLTFDHICLILVPLFSFLSPFASSFSLYITHVYICTSVLFLFELYEGKLQTWCPVTPKYFSVCSWKTCILFDSRTGIQNRKLTLLTL